MKTQNRSYREIAEVIKKRIENNEYPTNALIPKQVALAEEFSVSRTTIAKALDILISRGFLYTRRGAGTFVTKSMVLSKQDFYVQDYIGLTNQFPDDTVTSKIILFEIVFPDEKVQSALNLKAEAPVYNIIRLRLLNGQNYMLEHTRMPVHLIKGLHPEILQKSIYKYIKETLQLTMSGAWRKIFADKPNEQDKKYLGCTETDPVMRVEQIVCLTDGEPFEYSITTRKYDQGSFIVIDQKSRY